MRLICSLFLTKVTRKARGFDPHTAMGTAQTSWVPTCMTRPPKYCCQMVRRGPVVAAAVVWLIQVCWLAPSMVSLVPVRRVSR